MMLDISFISLPRLSFRRISSGRELAIHRSPNGYEHLGKDASPEGSEIFCPQAILSLPGFPAPFCASLQLGCSRGCRGRDAQAQFALANDYFRARYMTL